MKDLERLDHLCSEVKRVSNELRAIKRELLNLQKSLRITETEPHEQVARLKLTAIVEGYSSHKSLDVSKVWIILYEQFERRTGVRFKAKFGCRTKLDWYVASGHLSALVALAEELFGTVDHKGRFTPNCVTKTRLLSNKYGE